MSHVENNSRRADIAQTQWRAGVMALPNAKGRPHAAARIAELSRPGAQPLASVDAKLGRLPRVWGAPAATAQGSQDKLARRIELRIAALSYRGGAAANLEVGKLKTALAMRNASPEVAMSTALKMAGVDPETFAQ